MLMLLCPICQLRAIMMIRTTITAAKAPSILFLIVELKRGRFLEEP